MGDYSAYGDLIGAMHIEDGWVAFYFKSKTGDSTDSFEMLHEFPTREIAIAVQTAVKTGLWAYGVVTG